MRVLGIETSCDETAVCIIDADGDFSHFTCRVLGNALLSQAALHAPYGGVFPNLAKREHELNLVPLLEKALTDADLNLPGASSTDLSTILAREATLREATETFLTSHARPPIDCITVTFGPGLEPALWVGVNFAKALAAAWKVPIVPVNHMEGHVVISALDDINDSTSQRAQLKKIDFPLLTLLISGGHTELVLSREWMQYELIGATRDDAVGEAFDKVARLLGLPYPGGPEISRIAESLRTVGTHENIALPRPMIDSMDYDFSFAGLKTAVRRVVEAETLTEDRRNMIALAFENACADVLVSKTLRAVEEYGVKTLLVGGGVSANTHIRTELARAIDESGLETQLCIPPASLATDNALMIAIAGYFRARAGEYVEPDSIRAHGTARLHS